MEDSLALFHTSAVLSRLKKERFYLTFFNFFFLRGNTMPIIPRRIARASGETACSKNLHHEGYMEAKLGFLHNDNYEGVYDIASMHGETHNSEAQKKLNQETGELCTGAGTCSQAHEEE